MNAGARAKHVLAMRVRTGGAAACAVIAARLRAAPPGAALPAGSGRRNMAETRRFSGITLERLSRMHAAGSTDYTLSLDPDRSGGTVSRTTPLGDVIVRFTHDRRRAEMTVVILQKPRLLPAAMVWAGVLHALHLR